MVSFYGREALAREANWSEVSAPFQGYMVRIRSRPRAADLLAVLAGPCRWAIIARPFRAKIVVGLRGQLVICSRRSGDGLPRGGQPVLRLWGLASGSTPGNLMEKLRACL